MMLAACAVVPNNNSTAFAQTAEHPLFFPTTIELPRQEGVSKYRLQIAEDERFRNVLFDVRLAGGPHNVCWLSPGYYYWRVAPIERTTGTFLEPVRFFVSGGVGLSGRPRRSLGAQPESRGSSVSRIRSRGLKNVGS